MAWLIAITPSISDIIERLEYSITVCSDLLENTRGVSRLEDYSRSIQELIDCVKRICKKWEEYEDMLDSYTRGLQWHMRLQYRHPDLSSGRQRYEISWNTFLRYHSNVTKLLHCWE